RRFAAIRWEPRLAVQWAKDSSERGAYERMISCRWPRVSQVLGNQRREHESDWLKGCAASAPRSLAASRAVDPLNQLPKPKGENGSGLLPGVFFSFPNGPP